MNCSPAYETLVTTSVLQERQVEVPLTNMTPGSDEVEQSRSRGKEVHIPVGEYDKLGKSIVESPLEAAAIVTWLSTQLLRPNVSSQGSRTNQPSSYQMRFKTSWKTSILSRHGSVCLGLVTCRRPENTR